MKCPTCGTNNGRTNKFCRGCGTRLDVIKPSDADLHDATCPPDDIARGEELFEVWQLYSADELDAALEKVQEIIECNPESASAHSIRSLIYQRQAEEKFRAGQENEGRGLLELAILDYDRIVELNPDSTADKEKLASLRLQLLGRKRAASKSRLIKFRQAFDAVPLQWRVAFGVFLLVLVVLIIAMPDSGRRNTAGAAAGAQASITPSTRISTAATASDEPVAASADSPASLRVYTFPRVQETRPEYGAATRSDTPPPPPKDDRIKMPDEPVRLPSALADVKVVPAQPPAPKKPANGAARQEPAKPAEVEPREQPGDETPDGGSTLATAIELRNQGRTDEALDVAEQALKLYNAEAEAGRNKTEAERGAENTRKLIRLWKLENGGNGQ